MAEHSLTSRKENGDPDYLFTLSGATSVNQGMRFNGHIEKKPSALMITRRQDQFLFGTGTRPHVMKGQH